MTISNVNSPNMEWRYSKLYNGDSYTHLAMGANDAIIVVSEDLKNGGEAYHVRMVNS